MNDYFCLLDKIIKYFFSFFSQHSYRFSMNKQLLNRRRIKHKKYTRFVVFTKYCLKPKLMFIYVWIKSRYAYVAVKRIYREGKIWSRLTDCVRWNTETFDSIYFHEAPFCRKIYSSNFIFLLRNTWNLGVIRSSHQFLISPLLTFLYRL